MVSTLYKCPPANFCFPPSLQSVEHLYSSSFAISLFNHFVLAGAKNINVIITYRFLAAPVKANRDFFWDTDCIFHL